MLFLLLLTSAIAFLLTAMLIRYARAAHYDAGKPQRFHIGDVPRLGGVGMLAGVTAGWLWMVLSARFRVPNQIQFEPCWRLPCGWPSSSPWLAASSKTSRSG
jgi:UDP-GlcNAc:undecaprenyl-phosphate GlcNAc-1-phosphate transferase